MQTFLQKNPHRELWAEGMLLLAGIIWGGGFVAGKLAISGLNPFAVLSWRFGGSAVGFFLLFSKRILRAPLHTVIYGIVIGCTQMLALSLQLIGLQYTTSAKQSFLCTAYVALAPFASFFILHNKLRWRDVLAGFVCLAGMALICLSGGERELNFGDMLSLGCGIVFSLQVVLIGRFASKGIDSVAFSFYQFFVAAAIALAVCLARGETLITADQNSLYGISYLILLNTMLAFLLQNEAQKYVRDSLAALLISLEGVFGFLASWVWFREPVTSRFAVGAVMCFSAVLLSSIPNDHKKNNVIQNNEYLSAQGEDQNSHS